MEPSLNALAASQTISISVSHSFRKNGTSIEQQLEQTADTDLSRRVLGLLKKQGAHFDEKYRWA
jgi:hypothetical protein